LAMYKPPLLWPHCPLLNLQEGFCLLPCLNIEFFEQNEVQNESWNLTTGTRVRRTYWSEGTLFLHIESRYDKPFLRKKKIQLISGRRKLDLCKAAFTTSACPCAAAVKAPRRT
jgi:hypothetical protein